MEQGPGTRGTDCTAVRSKIKDQRARNSVNNREISAGLAHALSPVRVGERAWRRRRVEIDR